jgi:mannose-6-phosphate isomerase-like protein (cupin superfamily)
MNRIASVGVWVLVAGTVGLARQGQSPVPPAPAPGSPAIYKSAAELAEGLRTGTPNAAAMTLSPIARNDQYSINVVHRAKATGALAHPGNTELHYILEGSGTVVTGGTIVKGAGGATVEGGESRRFSKGDVIVVPAGSPHWYSATDGPITYLEVRWLAPPQ